LIERGVRPHNTPVRQEQESGRRLASGLDYAGVPVQMGMREACSCEERFHIPRIRW
jgi:hypothetical protein